MLFAPAREWEVFSANRGEKDSRKKNDVPRPGDDRTADSTASILQF